MNFSERAFFDALLIGWFVLSAVVVLILKRLSAPYGRHVRGGWGPQIWSPLGWVLMETPAVATFFVFFALGERQTNPVALVFLVMWQVHYVHRAFVYPFCRRHHSGRMPVLVVVLGAFTNVGLGYLISRGLNTFGPERTWLWFSDPRFIVGALLFVIGMSVNRHSDRVLLRLRGPGETDYKIPYGGAYRWVSCPNYLGELIEWSGFAMATWSLPALAFAVWTAANLVPRAQVHHRWYRQKFEDYPSERTALIPFVL